MRKGSALLFLVCALFFSTAAWAETQHAKHIREATALVLEMAKQDGLQIDKISLDDPAGIDRAIQAGVSSVPTFIRYDDDGTETERHVGAMGYKDLVGMLTR